LGGGLELALASHIRIASDNAKMGLPEVSLGVIPGYGGTQRLANLVGKGKAIEMITTAAMLSAKEAKEWGLVNYVCSQDELLSLAEKIASKIKRNSPMAIKNAIKSINSGFITGVDGFEVEKKKFGSCFGTPEFIEGTNAFIEKRKPNF
jgi:enoyl-CoA hydratase